MSAPLIKVTSRSFSTHPVLRREILDAFPATVFNDDGATYSADSMADYLHDADGAVIALDPVNEALLSRCPNLKIIAKYGVGLDNIDQDACAAHDVKLGWTGGLNKRGVAEMALCFMIGLCRHILFSERGLRNDNDWTKNGGTQLSGRTIGIIGVGFVGKELIDLLTPFDCRILVNDIIDQADYYRDHGLVEASKDEIFSQADVITIHTPLDDSTRHMVNDATLGQMKETAYLINVARGAIIDQAALKRTLKSSNIAGAAVDVFEVEPCGDADYLSLPNLYCTPHMWPCVALSLRPFVRVSLCPSVPAFTASPGVCQALSGTLL